MFHSVIVLVGISAVNCMFYKPYGYYTVPFFNYHLPNHSLNMVLMVLFFYAVYYSLSHLSFFKRIVFSGTVAMLSNVFYDMFWNFFYLNAIELPFHNLLNLISLSGLVVGLVLVLTKLDKDFCLFYVTKGRVIQLVTAIFIMVCFLSYMFVTGFFNGYFNYIMFGDLDPHGSMWAISRIVSFAIWLPILRWKHG